VDEKRRITKLSPDEALTVAIRLHQEGHLAEAHELYGNILKVLPDHPDALHFMGVVTHQLGDSEEAVALIRRAIAASPGHAGAYNNLGNILKQQGRESEAETAYRRAIELAPDSADARNNLGVLLKNRGLLDEAVSQYEAALRSAPRSADLHHNLAAALRAQGRLDEAVRAARRSIELSPEHARAYQNLAASLYEAGKVEEAVKVLEQWLRFSPNHPLAGHMLAAYGGGEAPERAADGFVREVFDDFAASFDTVLGGLDYQGPALIAAAMAAALPPPSKQLEILDGGCGTGLCAPVLAAHARRLVGVDLSPAMVALARRRGAYDELVTAELVGYLERCATPFDLIVSADTLVYIGNVMPLFAAVRARLRPGGHFIFTVERDESPGASPGFRLQPTCRYSHSQGYLAKSLAEAGLRAVVFTPCDIRRERGAPVKGLVVTAAGPRVA